MSSAAKDIINKMNEIAPENLCCEWDNVGVMVGDTNKEVKTVLIALDCTDAVIKEATENKADMIITHHPLIFRPIKNLDYSEPLSQKIEKLIKNDILVYSAHTNLDIADHGTNYTLAELLGLKNIEGLVPMGENAYMGRTGELEEEITFSQLTDIVKTKLKTNFITVNGDLSKKVKKIAVCTGAGADYDFMLQAKKAGADAYITGDVGYHDAQTAENMGLLLIDATHYLTEVIVTNSLYKLLSSEFREVKFIESGTNGQTLNIV